jgi:hypothetical protein
MLKRKPGKADEIRVSESFPYSYLYFVFVFPYLFSVSGLSFILTSLFSSPFRKSKREIRFGKKIGLRRNGLFFFYKQGKTRENIFI